MRAFAIAVIFLSGILGVSAQSGDELARLCQTNRVLIVGYVAGVLDKASVDTDILFHFYFDTYEGGKTAERIESENRALVASSAAIDGYCIPEETTAEQKADVFCRYLLSYPDQRDKNAAELLGTAAKYAWPCK
jgi:Rap1a immunity proteins